MNSSLITIGITAFNAEESIKNAVNSAVGQSWPNIEIIIVDDFSSDGTSSILKAMCAQFPQLRVYRNQVNCGVSVSRNRIIDEAKGEFLAFFDDDDQSMPDRLKQQYFRIIEYERNFSGGDPVICHAARTQCYPDNTSRYEATMGTNIHAVAPNGDTVAERILTGRFSEDIFGSTATCSQMARITVYRSLGGFDSTFRRSEDTDFNVRLALEGGHFVGISEPLVIQTMTLSSDKNLDEERSCALQLLEKHRGFISRIGSYSFCVAWIEAKYDYLSGKRLSFLLKFLLLAIFRPLETGKRLRAILPNIGFNIKLKSFHNER